MLEYKLNKNNIGIDTVKVPVLSYDVAIINGKKVFICYYADSISLKQNQKVRITKSYEIYTETSDEDYETISDTTEHNILYGDEGDYFVVEIDPEYDIDISKIYIYNGKIYFSFVNGCYFVNDLYGSENENEFRIQYYDLEGNLKTVTFKNFNVINNILVEWEIPSTISSDVQNFLDSLSGTSKYEQILPSEIDENVDVSLIPEWDSSVNGNIEMFSGKYSDPIYYSVPDECRNLSYYRRVDDLFDISGIYRTFRTNFWWYDSEIVVYADIPTLNVPIPISMKGNIDMYRDDLIEEEFFEKKEKEAINPIVEMEKNVYHPVIYKNENEFEDVYKIRFNLHFREHRGDNWEVSEDSYWNGCTYSYEQLRPNEQSNLPTCPIDDYNEEPNANDENSPLLIRINGVIHMKKVKLMDDVALGTDTPYFSYVDKSQQSDLLKYLGFKDSDVKFQKSALKKSFLRLSFYDSTEVGTQNLLATYTVFINAGRLYSKMLKNSGKYPYLVLNDMDSNLKLGLIKNIKGANTSTEPYDTLISTPRIDDEIEELRLSSQLTIEDTYSSEASSEGFYLYLWKENFNGTVPTHIYMKAEFNHAGYGRTIPLMAPFWDPDRDNRQGFKTFEEIVKDFQDYRGYGIKKYQKYTYVHFKYQYDKENDRCIYFLDNDFYGANAIYGNSNANIKENELTINLYEAKLTL